MNAASRAPPARDQTVDNWRSLVGKLRADRYDPWTEGEPRMAKSKAFIPNKLRPWIEARQRFHLS
jgi:hypothetical protein